MKNTRFSVVLLAGGRGTRFGSTLPKQYTLVNQKPLAIYSFEVFLSLPEIEQCIIVCEPQFDTLFLKKADTMRLPIQFARPGLRRQDSLYNGIQLLPDQALVCIHDAARPLIDSATVRRAVEAAAHCDAAVVGVRVKSTIKICDPSGMIVETPERSSLWEIQTPQVIRCKLLKEGLLYAHKHQLTVTDDASLVELLEKPVKVIEGSYTNVKVTTKEDLSFVEMIINTHALL